MQDKFPEVLRQAFKSRWDGTFGLRPGFRPWDDSATVREMFRTIQGGSTRVPIDRSYEEWDCRDLFQATINSVWDCPDVFQVFRATINRTLFQLYVSPRKVRSRSFHPSVVSRKQDYAETFTLAIDQLRRLRNSHWNSPSSEMDKETFQRYVKYGKDAFEALGVTSNFANTAGCAREVIKEIRTELKKEMKIVLKEVEVHLRDIRSDIAQSHLARQKDLKEVETGRKEELEDLANQLQLAKDEFQEQVEALIAAIREYSDALTLKENLDDIFNNKSLGNLLLIIDATRVNLLKKLCCE